MSTTTTGTLKLFSLSQSFSLGSSPRFPCFADVLIVSIQWYIDGVVTGNSSDVLIREDIDMMFGTLTFSYLSLDYNATRLQCRAQLGSGCGELFSNNVTLDIQGLYDSSLHMAIDLAASIEDDAQTIHVQYLENTRARGSLVLIMLTSSGKVDFSKSLYLALDRESSHDYTLSSPLSSGWYIFSVYDIEENGTVQGHIAYPAFSQNHFVMRNAQGWLRVVF